jgi:transposase-like protein
MNAEQNNAGKNVTTGQNKVTAYPKTLMDAVVYFAAPSVALNFFAGMRWPDGVVCPHCGSRNVLFMAKYSRWKCREGHARPQFTVKVGTVMEDSPLGLDKWAVGIWLEVNAKNSISSYEIHRALGITQKSAWFMQHRIRFALHQGSFEKPMSGTVEADETFIGGLARNMHKSKRERVITGTGGMNKTAVMGLLERHAEKGKSQVRTQVVEDRKGETLRPIVAQNVKAGSNVYTDALPAYAGLSTEFFHDFVDHAECYAKGAVHTNGLENFWALFKRCIKGTHVSVEPFHLFRYLDSEAFRFNNRTLKDGERFAVVAAMLAGKRLTYKVLTGESEVAPSSDSDGASASPLN